MKKILMTLMMLAVCSPAWGATYYVSPSGSNASPYDTWAKAATNIATALNAATASGDIIEIDGGTSGITYAVIDTSYDGVTFRGSSEPGHNGQVTIDGVTSNALLLDKTTTFERLKFKTTTAYTINAVATGIFNDCIIGDALSPKNLYTPTANTFSLTFNRCSIYKKPDGNLLVSLSQATVTTKFNNCFFYDIQDTASITAGNAQFNNCMFIGNRKHSLITTSGTGAPVVAINNSVFTGNYLDNETSYLIHHGAKGGGGITVTKSYFNPSMFTYKSPISSTVTDGGGNIGLTKATALGMQFVAPRMPAYFVFMNENAEQYLYFDAMAKNLEARGGRGTWTVATANMTPTAWEYASNFIARGHEVSSRTRQNVDLSDLKAFRLSRAGYTITIASGRITSNPAGIDLALSDYPTVTALVAAISSISASFNCIVEPSNGLHTQYGNPSPTTLADVTNLDISTTTTLSHDQTRFFEYQILGSKQDIDNKLGAGACKTLTVYNNLIGTDGKLYAKSVGYTSIRGARSWPYYPSVMNSESNDLQITSIPSEMSRMVISKCAGVTDAAFADRTPASMPAGWQRGFDVMLDVMQAHGGIMAMGNYMQGMPISGNTEASQEQLAAVMDHLIMRGAKLTTMATAAQWILGNATSAYDSTKAAVALDSNVAMYYKVAPKNGDYHLFPNSPAIGAGVAITGIHDQATPATDADGKIVHFLPPSIGAYDGQGTTKTITSDFAPTGYTVRGTDAEPATLVINAHDLSIDLSGLTADEAIVAKSGSKRVKGFVAKGSKQYLKGSGGGSGSVSLWP